MLSDFFAERRKQQKEAKEKRPEQCEPLETARTSLDD
jgi:hypothetical protein